MSAETNHSIPHMHYFATHDPMIWVSRSWDLIWPSQKDLWPLQWSFPRPWRLEKPLCACYAWANEGKWSATNSCPHQNPLTLLGVCRQPHRGDTDVTCLPCFCWQQLQASHRCVSATKKRWACFPPFFPALGSTSDVQHMPEDSLFSSGA